MTLVDTNILLDLLKDDPDWSDWSVRQLKAAAARGPLRINDVVYAELSVGAERIEQIDAFLAGITIDIMPSSRQSLFLAAKAFASYRARGGIKTGVLPDFFVGAQAAVECVPLLTRDAARYRTYFPVVELIAP